MTSPTSPGSVSDDLRVVAPAFTDLRALAAAPVSVATWRGISQTVVGSFVLLVAFIGLVVALVPVASPWSLLLVGIPMLVATLWAGRPFAQLERARLRGAARGRDRGADLPAPRRVVGVVVGDPVRQPHLGALAYVVRRRR